MTRPGAAVVSIVLALAPTGRLRAAINTGNNLLYLLLGWMMASIVAWPVVTG